MKLSIDVATFIGRLPIGKQGENLTTQIVFDCANWLGELTGGTLSIVHQRPSDVDGYPCGDYETTDTTLTWDINETDLAFCGCGQAELRYTIGDRIAKSRTFTTQILKALTPLDTPPEAYEPYIDRVIDAATQEMEKMTATAEAHQSSSTLPSATIEVTRVDDDHTNLHFIFDMVKGMGVDIHSANVYEDATKPSPFVEVVPYAATPSMELVDINFYNIKGEQGEPGDSIGTVTATVDSGVGTPSVDVTQTGGSGSPINLSLAFHNLKGSIDPSYLPSDHATGNPATFPDGARDIPVDSLEADINPIQDLHGYDKPWAAGAGKNICPNIFTSQTISDVVFTVNSDGSIKVKGTASATIAFNITDNSNPIRLKANTEYTISGCPAGGSTATYELRLVNSPEGYTNVATDNGSGTTYTPTADGNYGCRIVIRSGQSVDFTFYPMVRLSSTQAGYEPYANVCPISGRSSVDLTINGDTDSIALGQTVYGGKLNVTTGVLTIDKGFISDLSQLTWNYHSSSYHNIFTADISDIFNVTESADRNKWFVCSEYTPSQTTAINNTMANCGALVASKSLKLRNDAYNDDLQGFVSSLSGVQFAYRLATPTTVQLTPQEVLTVLGSNSMAADSGDVTVYYRADIGLYIDKKTS